MAYPDKDPEVLYDLALTRLERQLASADAIDVKLGIFFAGGTALIGILAAAFALNPKAFRGGGRRSSLLAWRST